MVDPIKRIRYHTFKGGRYKFRYKEPEKVLSKDELVEIRQRCNVADGETIVGATDSNHSKIKEMIPSYGKNLIEDEALFNEIRPIAAKDTNNIYYIEITAK